MANGERCKYCGYQETDHEEDMISRHPSTKLHGYKYTLRGCRGFISKKAHSHKSLEKERFEIAVEEKRGQERAAWGGWITYIAQHQFKENISALDRSIRRGGENAQKAQAEKDALLAKARNYNLMYVG